MSSTRLWLPAAALSLVFALGAAHALTSRPRAIDAAARRLPTFSPMQGDASGHRSTAPGDSVETILARPIFAPSRRPPAVAAAVPAAPVAAPAIAELPRLTGVVTSSSDRLALFAAGENRVMEAAEGDSIGGYVIRSISPSEVVLAGPDGERALRPSFVKIVPHVIHAVQEASAP